MARSSAITELYAAGFTKDDVKLALQTQAAQRKSGARVQSLDVICGHKAPPKTRRSGGVQHASNSVDVEASISKGMRFRGKYGESALLLERIAVEEKQPERKAQAKQLAASVREMSHTGPLQYDFFGGGNMSISHQYFDEVTTRLRGKFERGRRGNLMEVLMTIARHLKWESYECGLNASELAEKVDMNRGHMADCLKDLENIGAIFRVKSGRSKIICLNPEAAYRGNVMHHGQAVERFGLTVIQGGRQEPESPLSCNDTPPPKGVK